MPSNGRTSAKALEDLKDHFREVCSVLGMLDPVQIAARTAGGVVPETVMKMFSGPALPAWEYWLQVTEALGGDVQVIEKLWVTAVKEEGSFELGQAGSGHTTAGEHAIAIPSDPEHLQALGRQLRRRADAEREHHDEIVRGMRSVEGEVDRVSALIEALRRKADEDRLAQRINELESERRRLRREIKRLKGELYAVSTERERIATELAEVNYRLVEFQFERAQYEERLKYQAELQLRDTQEELRKIDEAWGIRMKRLTEELSSIQEKAGREAVELRQSLSEMSRDRANFQRANQQLRAENKECGAALDAARKTIDQVYRRWWVRLLVPRQLSGTGGPVRS
ncbi:hypothetical protein GA0070216_115121 [Micromonospora matsumotoense]|uniref:Uncharacterized protein n=1 Tax=Micromonospora matsumotoense TaxID=121616 RepID=A0A1C5AC19_9ACTN|nr:hypothetical protein [Micromonospora matsumotoense]SCF42770.1 hypothetical protein GA0070216_115121 [Micromonospora matsumotoense]